MTRVESSRPENVRRLAATHFFFFMPETITDPEQPQRPANRQELYDTIRNSSKEQFILEDMKRLGFWEKDTDQPSVAGQLIQRETQLYKELNALTTEKRRVEDQEALLKQLRKERLAESRRKREENKQKRLALVQQKKEAWKAAQVNSIGYLGEAVSGGLSDILSDIAKLQQNGLPLFNTPADVANAMNISVSQLRFLAFNRSISKVNHYRRFAIPKKTGGTRKISAPMYKLKDVQHWVLQNILNKTEIHEAAHGFVTGRSIVSNATPHVQAAVVINFDLKDFFPGIDFKRIKGVYKHMGYSESVATVLALICTEADVDEAILDGEKWFIGNGERHLPQGAPTSPALTNIICRKLDKRLTGLAAKLSFKYTRYADDLSFSSGIDHNINALQQCLQKIVTDEGFTLHPDKTRIMRTGAKKEVTGITVNDKPGVDRKTLKKFRAALHQLETKGAVHTHWGQSPDIVASMEGYANFVLMVDQEKGTKLKEKVATLMPALLQLHKRVSKKPYPKRTPITSSISIEDATVTDLENTTTGNTTAKKPWWKLWGR